MEQLSRSDFLERTAAAQVLIGEILSTVKIYGENMPNEDIIKSLRNTADTLEEAFKTQVYRMGFTAVPGSAEPPQDDTYDPFAL